MSKIYFVMPAYNEEAIIADTIMQWYSVVERAGGDCRLVVADDGSRDRTYEILVELESRLPQLVALTKPNQGHGATLLYLYRYAIAHGADYIFQTDSDGQTAPGEFGAFADAISHYDCVLGARPVRGDGKVRKLVENVLRAYVWLFFHVWVADANAPFRLMKAQVVAKYLGVMPADFYLPNAVLSACFSRFHERVKYIDITFKPRKNGAGSISGRKIMRTGWKAMADFHRIAKKVDSMG